MKQGGAVRDKSCWRTEMGFGSRERQRLLSQSSTKACDKVEREMISKQTSAYVRGGLRLIRLVRTMLQKASGVMLKIFRLLSADRDILQAEEHSLGS